MIFFSLSYGFLFVQVREMGWRSRMKWNKKKSVFRFHKFVNTIVLIESLLNETEHDTWVMIVIHSNGFPINLFTHSSNLISLQIVFLFYLCRVTNEVLIFVFIQHNMLCLFVIARNRTLRTFTQNPSDFSRCSIMHALRGIEGFNLW